MPGRLVSRAEFARRAGVSRAAVTKALRGSLGAAARGEQVDADDPAARAYVALRTGKPTALRPSTRRRREAALRAALGRWAFARREEAAASTAVLRAANALLSPEGAEP